ncbi:hypothetical protein Tco_0422173 [Tanacetum coccineum]
MESQSKTTQTVFALKLPILKTGDYDLWSMRMEQYLTHTDYALWEVIVNGDAPTIASASAGTEAWNNIALIMRNKSDLDTLSMDDLYNNLKVYEYEIKVQSISSSNSEECWVLYLQKTLVSQLDNEDLSRLILIDLENSTDLKWHVAMLHGVKKILKERQEGYQMGLESLEARIVVHEKNEAVYAEDIAFLQVPTPKLGILHDLRPDLSFVGLDDSVYKTKVSETITTASKTSKDNLEKPKTVRPSAPIIEDWDTDSDNDSVFRPKADKINMFTKSILSMRM